MSNRMEDEFGEIEPIETNSPDDEFGEIEPVEEHVEEVDPPKTGWERRHQNQETSKIDLGEKLRRAIQGTPLSSGSATDTHDRSALEQGWRGGNDAANKIFHLPFKAVSKLGRGIGMVMNAVGLGEYGGRMMINDADAWDRKLEKWFPTNTARYIDSLGNDVTDDWGVSAGDFASGASAGAIEFIADAALGNNLAGAVKAGLGTKAAISQIPNMVSVLSNTQETHDHLFKLAKDNGATDEEAENSAVSGATFASVMDSFFRTAGGGKTARDVTKLTSEELRYTVDPGKFTWGELERHVARQYAKKGAKEFAKAVGKDAALFGAQEAGMNEAEQIAKGEFKDFGPFAIVDDQGEVAWSFVKGAAKGAGMAVGMRGGAKIADSLNSFFVNKASGGQPKGPLTPAEAKMREVAAAQHDLLWKSKEGRETIVGMNPEGVANLIAEYQKTGKLPSEEMFAKAGIADNLTPDMFRTTDGKPLPEGFNPYKKLLDDFIKDGFTSEGLRGSRAAQQARLANPSEAAPMDKSQTAALAEHYKAQASAFGDVELKGFQLPIQIDENGKPVGSQAGTRVDANGKETPCTIIANDVESKVQIFDNEDGTFVVRNSRTGEQITLNDIDAVQDYANVYALQNQAQAVQNDFVRAYVAEVAAQNPNLVVDTDYRSVKEFMKDVVQAAKEGNPIHGIGKDEIVDIITSEGGTDADAIHCPDGSVVLLLDNLKHANRLEEILGKVEKREAPVEVEVDPVKDPEPVEVADDILAGRLDELNSRLLQLTQGTPEWNEVYQQVIAAQNAAARVAKRAAEKVVITGNAEPQKAEKPVETPVEKPAQKADAKPKVEAQTKTKVAEPPKETPKVEEDREKYRYLPDSYVEFAKKVEAGDEPTLKSEYVPEFYHQRGMRYGLVREDDGELHLVDPETGDIHDEEREKENQLRHREPYVRQSSEKDDYKIPFSDKTLPVEELSLDQVRAQIGKFASDEGRQQRFSDDAFVYNEKYRKATAAKVVEKLAVKGAKPLARAVAEAGHLVEIAGDNAPKTLVDALKDAKERLVSARTSEGGMNGSEINKKFSTEAWAEEEGLGAPFAKLARGHFFSKKTIDENALGANLNGDFLVGSGVDDGNITELASEVGVNPENDDGTLRPMGELVEEIAGKALEAKGRYDDWRAKKVEKYKADKRADSEHEVEVLSRGRRYDVIARGEKYNLDELEAREEADEAYVNAKAFVENKADENDYAIVSPEHLASAVKSGDSVLRLDHEKQTFDIISYDAKNGILTVADLKSEGEPRAFKVTADDIKEIPYDTLTETDPARNLDVDAQAPRGGEAQGTGSGSVEAQEALGGVREGSVVSHREGSPSAHAVVEKRKQKAKAYRDIFGVINPDAGVKFVVDGGSAAAVDFDYVVTPKMCEEWAESCKGKRIGSLDDAAHLCEQLSNPSQEINKVLYLSKDGTILLARADVGVSGVCFINTPKTVTDAPEGTRAVILSHNHPDSNTKPSGRDPNNTNSVGDIEAAEKAFDLFKERGIILLDSLVTDTDHYDSIANGGKGHEPVEKIREAQKGFLSGENLIQQPDDSFNIVPFAERIDFKKDPLRSTVKRVASSIDKLDQNSHYAIGITAGGFAIKVEKIPDDVSKFGETFKGCERVALILGKNQLDRNALLESYKKQFELEERFRDKDEKLKTSIVYVLNRSTGEEIYDNYHRVDDKFVGTDKTKEVVSKTETTTSKKTVSTPKTSVTSRMSEADKQKGIAALKAMRDILKAPVAKLVEEGGIGKIYSGSKRDYATKKDGRIDNGPAIFAIGSGTGGASYGWGLYGSKARTVAEGYAGGKDKGTLVEQTWFKNRKRGDESHLLDWSKPVSKANAKRIRDEWMNEFDEDLPGSISLTSGASAYNSLKHELGNDVESSMFLNRAGVDGTKSGDLYVTFSADHIRVDHKWLNGEMQYAPVEQFTEKKELTKDEKRALRNATEDMVEALTNSGMGDFESVARFIRENSPEAYEKVKPYLKNAYNSATDGDVSSAQANEIYGKIDNELKGATDATENSEATGNRDSESKGKNQSPRGEGARDGGDGVRTDVRGDGRGESSVGASPGGRGSAERPVAGRDKTLELRDESAANGGDVRGVGSERGGDNRGPDGTGDQRGDTSAVPRSESVDTGVVHDAAVSEEVTPGFMRYKAPEDLPVKAPSSDSLIVETSALASVNPPKIEKKPNIPDSIPASGTLQAHQYHAVCQAVNAHEKMLPDGRRYGYFCADGTGVGKTRVIAGIMTDSLNSNHGRGRCLIVSKDEALFSSALGDFEPFGIADQLLKLEPSKVGNKSQLALRGKGIAFTTYARLADNYQGLNQDGTVKFGKKKSGCQFADIVKWLGGTKPEDYDGVIALDEAHIASKDTGENEGRKQATRAQTVIDLQKKFPKARVVYLTATAAYDANDLRFLERMGLWGEGTGFKTRNDFVSAFGPNGENISLMEVMTQGLKARGLYCSRSISFKGVKCERHTHKLTDEQKAVHDAVRRALFGIYDGIDRVCSISGVKPTTPKMQFFGQGLRFFGSMMTSFKVDTAIELGKKALSEGKSPIFQLIETGAAIKSAKAKEVGIKARKPSASIFGSLPGFDAKEEADEDSASLRDKIIRFLKNDSCFPTHEPIYDIVNGKEKIVGWGDEIPEAAEIRDELIAACERLPVVGNPIDMIEAAFKNDGVSRVTGETPAVKRIEIVDQFNNGGNKVLIFSGAGGTGASYHASPKFKNQRQRIQIPIEFGWKPDDFIQALGRSHRNNQVVPPEFWLLTTDLPGEVRFMSTIASRIASMGAIVGGDRNSSGQVVGASDSLDNSYGRGSIRDFGHMVARGLSYGGVNAQTISGEMMLTSEKLRELPTNTFLGRLQLLSFENQKKIFDAVSEDISTRIEEAKKNGEYDDGIKKIDAKRTVVKSRESLSKDGGEETNRDLLTVGEWNDSRRLSLDDLMKRAGGNESRVTFGTNKKSGNLFAFIAGQDGKIRQYSPVRGSVGQVEPFDYKSNFDLLPSSTAKDLWNEQFGAAPAEEERTTYYMSGDLFPVWNKIGVDRPQVLRGSPSNTKPFIGVQIHENDLFKTLYGFGQEDRARKLFADKGYRILIRGGGVKYPLGEKGYGGQPELKAVSYQGKRVLAVLHVENNPEIAAYLGQNPNWSEGWFKDPDDAFDAGGRISYIPVSDNGAEDAYEYLVGKFGVIMYNGKDIRFATKKIQSERDLSISEILDEENRNPSYRIREAAIERTISSGRKAFAESVGMPNMSIVNNDGVIEFKPARGEWGGKEELKRALGGKDALGRNGRPYVTLPDGMRYDADRKVYTIPYEKLPEEVRSQIGANDVVRAPVESLSTGRVRAAFSSPESLASTIQYDIMRAEVAPLATSQDERFAKRTDDELVSIALKNPNSFGAIGELYSRYSLRPDKNHDLKGMIRQIANGSGFKMQEHDVNDVESLVWNGGQEHGGIFNEIRGGNTELFEKGFQKVLWDKARRFTKDFIRSGAKEAARTVHTDAKSADFDESLTSLLVAEKEVEQPTGKRVAFERGNVSARKELASIFDILENAGLPDKYLGWMRNYLAAVRDVEAEAYTRFADEYRELHDNPTTEHRHELEGRIQKYIRDNVMRRLGELGKRPEKLFAYEFQNMLDGIYTFLQTKNPIALPGDVFDSLEYTNEDLIAIMDESGDYKMADICSLREKGLTGKQIAEEMNLKHDDVRQTLTRARQQYGYRYDGENVGGKQMDWFDILGVAGEITKTEKSAARPKKTKSELKQSGFDFDEEVNETPAEQFAKMSDDENINSTVDDMIRLGYRNLDGIVEFSRSVLGDEADENVIRTVTRAKLSKAGGAEVEVADDKFFASRPDVGLTHDQEREAARKIAEENYVVTEKEFEDRAISEFKKGRSMAYVIHTLETSLGASHEKAVRIANMASFKARKNDPKPPKWPTGGGKKTPSKYAQDFMFESVEPLADDNGGLPEYLGFWNDQIDLQRKALGMSELKLGKETRKLEEIDRSAAALLRNEVDFERSISVWANTDYPVTAVEQAALDRYGVAKAREIESLRVLQEEANGAGNETLANELGHKIDGILAKLDEAQRVNQKIGRAWGLAGRARQMVYGKDMTLAAYLGACMKANGGMLPKDMKELATRLWKTLNAQNVRLTDARMKDLESVLNTEIEKWLAKTAKEDKAHRLGTPGAEKIVRDYESAAEILRHWAKKTGGVFQAIPNGQKLVRALERYHLINGEGYEDGKPSADRMVELLKKDLEDFGFEADAYEIRQMESRMGNATEPSKDEIERSLRDLHSQMLVSQQIEYILKYGELPPKTGFIRDEDTALVRELRRMRDRLIRENGLNAKDETERLASALKVLKTRIRNKNENVLKQIEIIKAGGTIPEEAKRGKIAPDDELAQLQAEYDENKRILEELKDPDGSVAAEKLVVAALRRLSDRKALLEQKLAEAKADPTGFAWDKEEKGAEDPRVVAAKAEIESLKREMKAVKDAAFTNGTEKEIAAYTARRINNLNAAYDKWNTALKTAMNETSWQAKWDSVHPTKRRQMPESDDVKIAKENVKNAYQACLKLRRKLEREDTRGANFDNWVRFLSTAPAMLRTIVDLSAAGVQGARIAASHPVMWGKALKEAIGAFALETKANTMIVDLRSHPYFDDFKSHGGHIYYMDGIDGDMPEDFRILDSGLELFGKEINLQKFPGVKRSARSFSGFLNRVNLELYRCMVEAAGRDGTGANDNVKTDIAKFVNLCTGYGYQNAQTSKSRFVKVADALMWAPRKAVGELKYFTGYALAEPYIGSRKSQKTPTDIGRAQKAIGREYGRFLLGVIAFNVAAALFSALFGDEENPNRWSEQMNPLSTDLGMWKIGNTRIDGLFGGSTIIRTIARFLMGKTRVNGVTKDKSRLDILLGYVRGKLTPVLGTAADLVSGKTYNGQPVDYSFGSIARNYLLPITTSAEIENFMKNDPLTAAILFFPTFIGMTKYTAEEDILSRASAQGADLDSRASGVIDEFDGERSKSLYEKLGKGEKSRAAAIEKANNVIKMEADLKTAKADIEKYENLLKKTPLVDRRKSIKKLIDGLENMIKSYEEKLPGLRKEAEEEVRRFNWTSVDAW